MEAIPKRDDEAGDLMMGVISRESISQQAYLAIRRALITSQFVPGQKLITRKLAAKLGISPTPVREALLKLVSESLLSIDARGTVQIPEMTRERYIEIRDLRVLLEGESAARAATTITAGELRELLRIQKVQEKALKDRVYGHALELNEQFHFTLCRFGRSDVLFKIVENLWLQCGPILGRLYENGHDPKVPSPHRKILDALTQRDAEAARRGIADDIVKGGLPLLDFLPPPGNPATDSTKPL